MKIAAHAIDAGHHQADRPVPGQTLQPRRQSATPGWSSRRRASGRPAWCGSPRYIPAAIRPTRRRTRPRHGGAESRHGSATCRRSQPPSPRNALTWRHIIRSETAARPALPYGISDADALDHGCATRGRPSRRSAHRPRRFRAESAPGRSAGTTPTGPRVAMFGRAPVRSSNVALARPGVGPGQVMRLGNRRDRDDTRTAVHRYPG